MLGRKLVKPLEDDWQRVLQTVARARGWPAVSDVGRLAALVQGLSASYNDSALARASTRDAGAARLGFSFARDAPKAAGAVRELIAVGRLGNQGTLRVLDVGAGLGASTWGVVRALEAAGGSGVVDATWIDEDADALRLGVAILQERQRARAADGDNLNGGIELRVRTVVRSAGALDDQGVFDLVLAGQLLSELDVGDEADARADRHAERLFTWLDRRLEADGSLVVIEPALRDRTRHLHRVRDALIRRGATVFAPCLHGDGCPALAREGDWCHEDLDVDLPPWLSPVARAAGLRREGLTFSYLVLRKDGVTLSVALSLSTPPIRDAERGGFLRVVSNSILTKGKREAFLCGNVVDDSDSRTGARVRATRLERDARESNSAWEHLERGDILCVEPELRLSRARIEQQSHLSLAGDVKSR